MVAIIVLHVIICIVLIGLVLIQRGRGGGLVESFSGVESMFGTKTNTFLTRTTTVCSTLFFLTCLSLAVLSVRQSKSLMRNIRPKAAVEETTTTGQKETGLTPETPAEQKLLEQVPPQQEAPKAEENKQEPPKAE